MRTIRTKIYNFTELSEEAQQYAITKYYDINTDYNWWENVYQDAENIELNITSFDLERKEITGKLYNGGLTTAKNIIDNHGKDCDTYKLAEQFIKEFEEAEKLVREEDFYDYFYDREKIFLKDVLNCYFKMLENELEYRESEEAITETLSNAYEFLSDGTIYYSSKTI